MNIDKKWSDEELLTTAFLVENPSTIEKFLNEFQIELEKIYFIKSFEYEDIKAEIKQRNIVQIISEKNFVQDLNLLQWECDTFNTYYIIDCVEPLKIKDTKENYLMNKKLWEYTVNNAKDEFAGGGWVNSYNRMPFSKIEMEEYSNNVLKKLKPYLKPNTKILEVGCSTGLTMFALLPFVESYCAIDLSSKVLEKNRKIALEKGYKNISLYNLPADKIELLKEYNFDIIIMNSVIQCFHGYNYFREVLEKCLQKINSHGIIFLGDIMDLELKTDLEQSLQEHKNQNPLDNTKLLTQGELFYARGFFQDCKAEFPQIKDIKFSQKIGTIENELTKYRYDAMLVIDKTIKNIRIEKRKKQIGLIL